MFLAPVNIGQCGVCLFWSGRSGWILALPTHLIRVSPVSVSGVLWLERGMTVVERLLAVEPLLRAVWRAQIRFGTISMSSPGQCRKRGPGEAVRPRSALTCVLSASEPPLS